MQRLIISISILATLLTCGIAAANSATQEQDSFTGVKRIIAVGDLHGDYEGMIQILGGSKVINNQGEWIGGKTHLVLLGDLVVGKADSRKILDFVMNLQDEAARAGGRVHVLMGNHDLMVASGDFSRMSKSERQAFLPEDVEGKKETKAELSELFLEGRYADWMASRPIAVKINDKLFVHAGFDEQALDWDLKRLNKMTSEWVRFFQGKVDKPAKETQWIVGLQKTEFERDIGPAFFRGYKVTRRLLRTDERPNDAIKRKALDKVLEHFAAKQMIIGHVATPHGKIITDHPLCGNKVVILDSRISDPKRGKLSALEISGEVESANYFERSKIKFQKTVGLCRSVFR